ncbi:MAG: hypothetical protein ACOX6G_03805 [Christensenellales bacterium]|jgi:hypothetical protein
MNALALYLIAPAILLIVTLILVQKAFKKVDNSIQIEGTIIRFDGRGRPIVSYNIDGADYVFVGNYRTSLMRIGQKIQILYDLEDHSKATIKAGLYLAPIITGGIALLFLLPGIVMLVLASGG